MLIDYNLHVKDVISKKERENNYSLIVFYIELQVNQNSLSVAPKVFKRKLHFQNIFF